MSAPTDPSVWNEDFEAEPGALTWLQAWYATQCDGDWEHEGGITIETLDNPGWAVRINLDGTGLAEKHFESNEVHRSDHDWCVTRVHGSTFEGFCGPLNLGEALYAFRQWAQELNKDAQTE